MLIVVLCWFVVVVGSMFVRILPSPKIGPMPMMVNEDTTDKDTIDLPLSVYRIDWILARALYI
jgi:hypothetical protein